MYLETSPGPGARACGGMLLDSSKPLALWSTPYGPMAVSTSYIRGKLGLRAVGAMTIEQRHFALPAGSRTIGVRFRPGMARPFLRIPPAELTDKIVGVGGSLGPTRARFGGRLESELSGRMLAVRLDRPAGARSGEARHRSHR